MGKQATGLIIYGDWNSLMDEKVFQNTDVRTVGFKLYWDFLNPKEGVYNFDILNKNLINCAIYGKQFSIIIAAGNKTPAYVYQAPYNVPKIRFVEFKRASIPVPPLKEFDVPMFTDDDYKMCFKLFMDAFLENMKNLKWQSFRDVMRLFVKISVSGVNETTGEFRINSQVSLTAEGVTSSNAVEIWKRYGINGNDVVESLKDFYYIVEDAFPRLEKSILFLAKGFPKLDDVEPLKAVIDWAKTDQLENVSFCYTSITTTGNGGTLSEYVKSSGFSLTGELNQSMYEFCEEKELDDVIGKAANYGLKALQIRETHVLNYPMIIAKYKDTFK